MESLDYYNDDKYIVSHDLEAINYMKEKKRLYDLFAYRDNDKFAKSISAYNDYVKYIAYLIKCMATPNNAISASIILGLLTKMGIFSDNFELTTGQNTKDIIFGVLGINIICGKAVCRHVANFQSDILKELSLFSEPLYCHLALGNIENIAMAEANHAINLIEYNNNLYGYDAYNDGIFSFIGRTKMRELFVSNPHYIYYKPYMNLVYNKETISSVNNLVSLFDVIKDNHIIDVAEYKMIMEEAGNTIYNSNLLLGEFHRSSKKYIKRITDNLK